MYVIISTTILLLNTTYKSLIFTPTLYIKQDDLLILPKELARNLSNISRLVLAKRIGSGIHVIDPLTGEVNYMGFILFFIV